MKNTTPLEKEEQIEFVNYCEMNNITVVHIANEFISRNYANSFSYIRSMKKQGYRIGIPDLLVLAKNKSQTHEALFIEMKRQKGGVLRDEQKEWIERLDNEGYCVGVAKGCQSAINILNNYLSS